MTRHYSPHCLLLLLPPRCARHRNCSHGSPSAPPTLEISAVYRIHHGLLFSRWCCGDLSRRHGEEERCSNCHLDGNHPATGPGLPSPAAVEQVPSLDQGQGAHQHEDCPSPHPDTSVDTAYTAGAPRPPPHPTLPPGPPQRPTYRLVATARRRSENHAKTAAGYTGLATVATQGWLHC